jgi:hypothetical protein
VKNKMMNDDESPLLALTNEELKQLIEAQGVAIPPTAVDQRDELIVLAEKHCRGGSSTASSSSSSSSATPMALEGADSTMVKLEGVDFMCPVCTELIYKPVTTPCGHTFCEVCLAMALAYKAKCPMCRETCGLSHPQFKVNVLMAAIIEQSFGDLYKKRAQEMEKQALVVRQGKKKLIIGNTHETVPSTSQNRHKWKFFCTVLDMDERLGVAPPSVPTSYYIQKVEVFLHPTFNPNRLVLTEQPFEFARIGWGVFQLKGTIHFQPKFNMRPIAFEHLLSFERNGTHREYHISFGGSSAEGQRS